MDPLYLKAVLAGLCFGLWPLFMNKSGLNSVEASAALSLFLLAVVAPFLLVNGLQQLSTIRWQMALPACLFDALGLLAFNSLLSSASSAQAGSAFVIVTVVQGRCSCRLSGNARRGTNATVGNGSGRCSYCSILAPVRV
jgi:predicted membrane-bound spermidine synthase